MVSPQVMQCYRENKLDFAQVQAFAISDDVGEQNKLLDGLAQMNWRMSASAIRAGLVKDEIPASDKRVQYVGLEFYEMCGGSVRRDLFDDHNSGYVQDVFLLNELVQNKIQSLSDELSAEGWSWVEYLASPDWRVMQQFTQREPVMRALSPEEAQHYEDVAEQLNDAQEEYDTQEELDPETEKAMLALQKELADLEQSFVVWTAEIKAETGVLIELERDGSVELKYGVIKRATVSESGNEISQKNYAASSTPPKAKQKPEFSASLMKDLTSHKTAALQIELAHRPDIALTSMVYSLALNVCYRYTSGSNCIKFSVLQPYLFPDDANIPALQALAAIKATFDLPESHRELWDWLLLRSQTEQLELLAFCLAHSIDVVQEDARLKLPSQHHSEQLSKALDLDMRKWFAPTADNTFNRLSRQQILEAYTETHGQEHADSLHKLKKGELAIRAEREIGDKWLPSVLRRTGDNVQAEA